MVNFLNLDKLKDKLSNLKQISDKAKPGDLVNAFRGMVDPDSVDDDYLTKTVISQDIKNELSSGLQDIEAVVEALMEANNEQQQVLRELAKEVKRLNQAMPSLLKRLQTLKHDDE